MAEYLSTNWPIVVVVALALIVLAFLVFGRRQSVRLTDAAPRRPHMAAGEGKSLADEAAAAASDVAGPILGAKIHAELPGASGPPDDLAQLKGVGPKLAQLLNQHGLTRFDQIAKLGPGQVEALDEALGAFRGRLTRDRIVEQADYLARGDRDGFEQRFGKL